jgi:hypothetical protein
VDGWVFEVFTGGIRNVKRLDSGKPTSCKAGYFFQTVSTSVGETVSWLHRDDKMAKMFCKLCQAAKSNCCKLLSQVSRADFYIQLASEMTAVAGLQIR